MLRTPLYSPFALIEAIMLQGFYDVCIERIKRNKHYNVRDENMTNVIFSVFLSMRSDPRMPLQNITALKVFIKYLQGFPLLISLKVSVGLNGMSILPTSMHVYHSFTKYMENVQLLLL